MINIFLYESGSWLKSLPKQQSSLPQKIFSLTCKLLVLIVKYLISSIFNNSECSINSIIKRELVFDRSFIAWNASYLLIRLHSLLTVFNQESNQFYVTMLKGYKFTFNYPNDSDPFKRKKIPCVFSKAQASERKLLICFSGHKGRFNMPIPIFHSIVSRYFTDVMYFHDKSQDFFIGKEDEIFDAIRDFRSMHSFAQISSIGTSGGAHMPIVLTNKKICTKSISCSPALKTYGIRKGRDIKFNSLSNRLFYCSSHHIDKYQMCEILNRYSEFTCSNVVDLASIPKKSNGNHATLATLVMNGLIDNELSWLSSF